MKLYHFNPNDWGGTFYVMEENKQKALESLIELLVKRVKDEERFNKESCLPKKYWSGSENKKSIK